MTVLFDYLTGNKTEGGTWNFISGQEGAPAAPGVFNGAIDFSSAANGDYVYRYQVTSGDCTVFSDVTVTVGPINLASNDECETAINISAHFSFSTSSIPSGTTTLNGAEIWTQGCEKDVATLSDDDPWASIADGDVWFRVPIPILSPAANYNVGVSVSSPFYFNGLAQPMLALYTGTDCDDLTLLDFAEGSGNFVSLVATITGTPTRLYIRVGAKNLNEGIFDITLSTGGS
jgi:hypothetical protein